MCECHTDCPEEGDNQVHTFCRKCGGKGVCNFAFLCFRLFAVVTAKRTPLLANCGRSLAACKRTSWSKRLERAKVDIN